MRRQNQIHANNPSNEFRLWVYFRIGWATYFGFIFAAVNTLVVTYYLAIENIPILQQVFPTFTHYIIATILVGIPVLIGVGYIHFKKSQAFKAESDVRVETNPHQHRILGNTEMILMIVFRLNTLLIKKLSNEKLTEYELNEIIDLRKRIKDYQNRRTLSEGVLYDIDRITN